jgi:phenylalanyl-tRNA synthetase beta chain
MKVSYRWIRSLAPELTQTPEEASERLAGLGFPVEGAETLAEGLGDIVVGRVVEVHSHPNADRLRVCNVDGGNGVVQVVCGADNVQAGAWYPLAPVGATLPGGMQIRKAKLRGEVSEGMLCSERELGLGRGHEGIMELAVEAEAFTPGVSLVEALGLQDVRLDVEITSNRPDLLSHQGIARELTPGGHASLVDPPIPGEDPGVVESLAGLPVVSGPEEVSVGGVTLRIQDPDLCPRYLGLVVRGVTVGPSPSWLQSRLRAAGARPINNVVDATNYVLLELGQPLHAFDLGQLAETTVVVRRAREKERIRTLDGEDRTLGPEMLAICDARKPIAVAGVMGGEESEVGRDTTDVLLECALFTPGPVRATRKALGLSTDASYRFERGVDPQGLRTALERCARIILATAGGEVGEAVLDVAPAPPSPIRVGLRPGRVERVLGVAFPVEAIRSLLEPLGFQLEEEDGGGNLSVQVPGFRSWDVTREVDLIEEIARRHGYDRFPDDLGAFRPGNVPDHPLFQLEDDLRTEMTAWGLLEAQTPAFAPEGEGEVEVVNPISMEERWLRGSLLPALLRRVRYNLARGNRDVRLYELGTVFAAGPRGELPRERTRLAVVLHGNRVPPHWAGTDEAVDLWEVKGILERILRRIPGTGWTLKPLDSRGTEKARSTEAPGLPVLEPGSSFQVLDEEGVQVGVGGRVPAGGLDLPPWAGAVWGVEVTLPAEPAVAPPVTMVPLPTHPGVDRDLALLVPEKHAAGGILERLRVQGGGVLREVRVFDVYRGEGVPEGFRSLAVRLHFRAEERTLTDGEVEEAVTGATRVLEEEFGVRIRGR